MGLSHFPSAAEGVLPVLVMNVVLSVALLKRLVRSLMQVMGSGGSDQNSTNLEEYPDENPARERRISITRFKCLPQDRVNNGGRDPGSDKRSWGLMECCVCLCRFEEDEEISELPCKHFFHRGCLDKWLDNKSTSCPLCRSIL